MDPLAFVRYLSTFGDVVALTTISDLLPDAAEMDPESCYLDFEVTLDSDAPLSDARGSLRFRPRGEPDRRSGRLQQPRRVGRPGRVVRPVGRADHPDPGGDGVRAGGAVRPRHEPQPGRPAAGSVPGRPARWRAERPAAPGGLGGASGGPAGSTAGRREPPRLRAGCVPAVTVPDANRAVSGSTPRGWTA